MAIENISFFKKNSFKDNDLKHKKTKLNGEHRGKLVSVKPSMGKAYKGTEPRPILTFFFELDNEMTVHRTVSASNHISSKCIELISEMSSPSIDVIKSPQKLQDHILGLIGHEFVLTIKPSDCGIYNNVVKVIPD